MLERAGIRTLADRIRQGELSPVELVDSLLERIDRHDPLLNAYVYLDPEAVRTDARAAEEKLRTGRELLPLLGVPIALKDNIDVAGIPTTAGSNSREEVAQEDAEVVRRLRAAGAIILGKLNLHEWAFGATGLNTAFGPARNPWDLERTPGGSSSGAASAVASGLAPAALGTDSGGSIRIPSALCGLTGLRPTVGHVSTRGVVPLTWTFDTIGPLALDAADAELLFTSIAGYDERDPHSRKPPRAHDSTNDHLRIGVLRGWFTDTTDPAITDLVDEALRSLERAGASLIEIVLEDAANIRDRMNEIIQADAAAAHRERLEHAPDTIAADVRARLQAGATLSAAAYAHAVEEQRHFRRRLRQLFSDVDVLATATTPISAPKLADCSDPEMGRTLTQLVYPFSFGGTPSISIPCGTLNGLPVGFQLIAAEFNEARLLSLGRTFQDVTDWHVLSP